MYQYGEERLLDLLLDMPEFSRKNAGRQLAGWRLLSSGNSTYYAVLRPGAFANDYDGMGRSHVVSTYRTVIELWEAWTSASETTAVLEGVTDAVIAHIERYPRLGDPARIAWAVPVGGSEMQEREMSNGSLWAVWEVNVDWETERNIEPAEDE